ncbi:MAG: serine/threonine-protein kinase [Myxococcota bacterium]|nr:serine/threonine-protein kinase [Myxococcota bacterium]
MAARSQREQQEIILLQERSAGTFARVYLAEARGADGLKRIVAVKLLKAQWSDEPDLLNRTRDEARLLARLHHRNILRVEGLAEHRGQPAIIMEFVDGVDLGQVIEKLDGPVPARAALQIIRDAAGALEAAYFRTPYGSEESLKVVHRDIKPSNIMVSVEGEVKVLDFGTAHYQNEIRLAQTGALRLGSLKYMSPERRGGDRGDHSCDIYALGIVLMEMLLGELLPVVPLDERQHDRLIASHISRIPSLGMPNPEWEEALQEALSRMCAHEPSSRLNATQLLQLLRSFSDQATGTSLDSYSAGPIRALARSLYGDGTEGRMTGNRLLVTLVTSGSSDAPSPIAAPGGHTTAHTNPNPSFHQPAAAPPKETPKETPNHVLFAVVGVLILGGIGLLMLMLVGAGYYFFWIPPVDAPTPEPAPSVVVSDGFTVHLSTESEDVQWLKLADSSGTQLMRADPQASMLVEPGVYQLSAKVIGHPAVSAELALDGDTDLVCTPASGLSVTCEDGDRTVSLIP